MKKRPFLDVLENASLVGLGVGSVASLVSQQAFYATAPLSLLVVLGLLNRRQFEQQTEQETKNTLNQADRRLTQQIDGLTQRVEQMPTPETIQQIKKGVLLKNRELAQHFSTQILSLQETLDQRLTPLEHQNLPLIRQELQSLGDRYQQLLEGLSLLNTDIGQLQDKDDRQTRQLEYTVSSLQAEMIDLRGELDSLAHHTKANSTDLQERLNRIDRQLSKLPPPVDVGVMRQELAEMVRIIGDLVSKRDLATIVGEVQALHQDQDDLKRSVQAIEAAAINLKRSFGLSFSKGEKAKIESEFAAFLAQQFGETAASLSETSLVPASIYPELQALAGGYLKNLRSQLVTIQEFTEQLDQQQQQLQEQIYRLPKSLDIVALQRQLKDLARRIPIAESTFDAFQARIQEVLQQELQAINEQLQALPATPQHELVFDFKAETAVSGTAGHRALLEAALEQTQERLILIWLWSDECELDDELLQKLESFLSQKRQLDLGWCHLADYSPGETVSYRQQERLLSKIRRGWSNQPEQTALQQTLQKLLQLKRAYPEYFQFKILGTSENFLVSDRAFAVLGIADPLKTTAASTDLHLKLRTTDPEVIQRLIDRFDSPTLDPDDLTAYWNRAVTRYDLSDKAGAIEDFYHILSRQPDDAVTLNSRGIALYDVGDWEAALLDFTQAIAVNPRQSAAYLNRGFIRSEQGDLWGAINDYTLAIQVNPDHALAYFYRGMAWQKQEEHREAIADFSSAIRLAPNSAVACYYRGLVWQKLGQLQEAIADLQKAAEHFSARGSKTNAEKALKHLAKLQQEIEQQAQIPLIEESELTDGTTGAIELFQPAREGDLGHHHYRGNKSQNGYRVAVVVAGDDRLERE
ncbi:tetratricopeptide repeat protein [Leptolyngbya sp. FACHB-711]|uniref:tetratricopeptide repeat protein n=1 Tax=unclassified Leptolyngbya TaxID=2650499 RepID=UPI00168377B5|nr:tetratricopeptide repeat protein [Leptolyngbya sp. FACHB-711]MBD1849961.1 tetratricopeptide repeat protein [Cyanobacteria bacterium FACHB-502]MBD2024833.1 tetratricopeptide repeat protein [Leptolyngbya sp. FACHB-711]